MLWPTKRVFLLLNNIYTTIKVMSLVFSVFLSMFWRHIPADFLSSLIP